jgi:hypothetical protein
MSIFDPFVAWMIFVSLLSIVAGGIVTKNERKELLRDLQIKWKIWMASQRLFIKAQKGFKDNASKLRVGDTFTVTMTINIKISDAEAPDVDSDSRKEGTFADQP